MPASENNLHCNISELSTELLLNDILEIWDLLLWKCVFKKWEEEFGEFLSILTIKENRIFSFSMIHKAL